MTDGPPLPSDRRGSVVSELSIGEFARRSGLSLKALRLYDARGLLPPVRVDDGSGYRFYAPEQLERAHTIALLRRLDMPLSTIADVLGAAARRRSASRCARGGRSAVATCRSAGPRWSWCSTSLGADASLDATGRFGVDDVVVAVAAGRGRWRRSSSTCSRRTSCRRSWPT